MYHQAFTTRYGGHVNELISEVTVEGAYSHIAAVFTAIWDTGAQGTVISQSVVDAISSKPTDVAWTEAVGSAPRLVGVHEINLTLPSELKILEWSVASASSIGGCDILIGMDIITLGDFAISNHRETTITFSIPPHDRIMDFVSRAESVNKRLEKKQRRQQASKSSSK